MPSDAEFTIEHVVPCTDLDAMTAFFVGEIGLRVDVVSPADDPAEVILTGHGTRVRLRRTDANRPVQLVVRTARLAAGASPERRTAPDGTVVEFISASDDVIVPEGEPSLSIVRAADDFCVGRAGMAYRDLLPGRWGGRFIASHIRIADEGDVADWVHFHRIRFQMIFVAAGWVDVVYEDQGPPFRMHAGDCVLQPPEIRHRVLRSSARLEVIEIGCPAVHDTVADHELTLPTGEPQPDRAFGGQRFVRHVAAGALTTEWVVPGFRCRDTGIGAATAGLAGARVLTRAAEPVATCTHHGEFAIEVVLRGSGEFRAASTVERLGSGDAVAVPAGTRWTWADCSDDFELLDVTLPAGAVAPVDDGG